MYVHSMEDEEMQVNGNCAVLVHFENFTNTLWINQLGGKLKKNNFPSRHLICVCEERLDKGVLETFFNYDDIHIITTSNSTDLKLISEKVCEIVHYNCINLLLSTSQHLDKLYMGLIACKLSSGLAADCSDFWVSGNTILFERIVGAWPPSVATIKSINSKIHMATLNEINLTDSYVEEKNHRIVFENYEVYGDKSSCFDRRKNNISADKDYDTYFIAGAGIHDYTNAIKLKEIAERYNIGFGITRQIYNRGWFDLKHLVGISGKSINANLCVTFGVSGAFQHLHGIKNCKQIIAINNNVTEPICKIASTIVSVDVNAFIEKLQYETIEKRREKQYEI